MNARFFKNGCLAMENVQVRDTKAAIKIARIHKFNVIEIMKNSSWNKNNSSWNDKCVKTITLIYKHSKEGL